MEILLLSQEERMMAQAITTIVRSITALTRKDSLRKILPSFLVATAIFTLMLGIVP
jgi:hypothetical protein